MPLFEKLRESNQLAAVSRAVRASASKAVEVEEPSVGQSNGRKEANGHKITDSKYKSSENTFLQPGHEEHVSKVEAVAPEGDVVEKGAQVGEGSQQRTGNGAEGSSEAEQLEASYKYSVICAFDSDLEALRQQEDGSSQPKLIALALESTWKSFSPFEQQMFRGTSI